jgi:hypothetical protein
MYSQPEDRKETGLQLDHAGIAKEGGGGQKAMLASFASLDRLLHSDPFRLPSLSIPSLPTSSTAL